MTGTYGRFAIGVDIGGTNIRAGRVSRAGEIVEWRTQPTQVEPRLALQQIESLVHSLINENVKAIGIGLPGRLDVKTNRILSGGYIDFTGFPLAAELETLFHLPVTLENDGNIALVGEQAVGRARGFSNVVMFTIGTGIGGAVFNGGRIFRGHMSAGQLGHFTVDFNGGECLCGRRGCVETTSSGTALGRHIAAAGLNPGTSIEELLAKSANGEALASLVLDKWAGPLRMAIYSAMAAFDPELVLLGGGLGVAAHRALERLPPLDTWFSFPVAAAELGDRAGVIGAGLSAFTPA